MNALVGSPCSSTAALIPPPAKPPIATPPIGVARALAGAPTIRAAFPTRGSTVAKRPPLAPAFLAKPASFDTTPASPPTGMNPAAVARASPGFSMERRVPPMFSLLNAVQRSPTVSPMERSWIGVRISMYFLMACSLVLSPGRRLWIPPRMPRTPVIGFMVC